MTEIIKGITKEEDYKIVQEQIKNFIGRKVTDIEIPESYSCVSIGFDNGDRLRLDGWNYERGKNQEILVCPIDKVGSGLKALESHALIGRIGLVYDSQNHPSFASDFSWFCAKTGNQPCLWLAACYLVYRPEIRSSHSQLSLSWLELESHCHRLAQTLHNHAKDDLVQVVRKLLENSPYQSLLEISPSSRHTDMYIGALQTALHVLRYYESGGKARIPFHPTAETGMDIHWSGATPLISEPVRGPFGNTTNPAIAGVDLGWSGLSFFGPIVKVTQGCKPLSPPSCSPD